MRLTGEVNRDLIRARLLAWYTDQARELPWRVPPMGNRRGDPYRIWLSEVMLQQTTVPHATPYFLKFTARWPTVRDLAAAPDEEVMAAWAGLGYYARARNLLACARAVVRDHDGVFPETEADLRRLPGLGPYTAAAVAAIAFDQPANVVDGNVERVMSRLFAVEMPLPDAKPTLNAHALGLVGPERPGDWAQALMDLGATVCRPRAPQCESCPLAEPCLGRASGQAETFPRKRTKLARPRRYGVAYVLTRGQQIGLETRPPSGLLGGMLGLPTTEWRATPFTDTEAVAAAPAVTVWRDAGAVEHVFTHFALTLRVFSGIGHAETLTWAETAALAGLPSVFMKAARVGL